MNHVTTNAVVHVVRWLEQVLKACHFLKPPYEARSLTVSFFWVKLDRICHIGPDVSRLPLQSKSLSGGTTCIVWYTALWRAIYYHFLLVKCCVWFLMCIVLVVTLYDVTMFASWVVVWRKKRTGSQYFLCRAWQWCIEMSWSSSVFVFCAQQPRVLKYEDNEICLAGTVKWFWVYMKFCLHLLSDVSGFS